MSERLQQLALRRTQLQARCELQRRQIFALAHDVEARLSGWDRGFRFIKLLTQRPVMIVAGLASAYFFGPKRLLSWLGRGTLLIGLVRKLAGFASKL